MSGVVCALFTFHFPLSTFAGAPVRFTDILRLSLSALWQQKVRTILTTLGVVFGTFVLVASVSVSGGGEETVVGEYGRHGALSRIMVYPGPGRPQAGPEIEVKGEMSADRRERLRQELQRHQPHVPDPAAEVRLTPARLSALAQLD